MSMDKPESETVNIPTDYQVVVPPNVLEEETKQLEQIQTQEQEFKPQYEIEQPTQTQRQEQDQHPYYALEGLRLEFESVQKQLEQEREEKKNLEEKYKQLEARTIVQPSNNFPALQGNNLKTKIVVNQVFREILQLKGSKKIYANILIDVSQNKYVRLEPA
jgi:hypothetical protein